MPEDILSNFPTLLERRLKLQLAPDKPVSEIIIKVGYPAWIQEGIEASCPVAIYGVSGPIVNIRGVDPMDAMKNAMTFIETYLADYQGNGVFFWPNGEKY